jgi:hypothetical protein
MVTRCAAGVGVPVSYVESGGEQAAYLAGADRMYAALATRDEQRAEARGQHLGSGTRS